MRTTDLRLETATGRTATRVCAIAAAVCLLFADALVPGARVHAQSSATLKVMDWNIQHGLDTSNVNNLERVVSWILTVDPDVVSLNEVEKQNGYNGNADEPAVLEADLEARTGVPWYGCFAQRDGAARGQGNLILSRIRIDSCQPRLLGSMRSVAQATISIDGTTIALFSTHLDDASASTRTAQIAELLSWAESSAGNRLMMGDFNASSTAAELAPIKVGWDDSWAVAAAAKTAITYPGNTAGNTRNGRIDYVWRSKTAARLVLQSAQVYDTGSVSDHRPVAATFLLPGSTTPPLPAPPANVRVIR